LTEGGDSRLVRIPIDMKIHSLVQPVEFGLWDKEIFLDMSVKVVIVIRDKVTMFWERRLEDAGELGEKAFSVPVIEIVDIRDNEKASFEKLSQQQRPKRVGVGFDADADIRF
jgi:hypothetical protein